MSVRVPEKASQARPSSGEGVFPEPHRMELGNGLRIALLDLPWSHWVAVEVALRAGALYETDAMAGASHFLEHLRCRRCLTPDGMSLCVDDALDGLGAYLDAYTSPDHTAYLVQIRPENCLKCLDILGCTLFCPDISPATVEVEKQVIQSEYASGNDDPEEVEYLARERVLWAEGLGRSTIGTPETIRALTAESLRTFNDTLYHPENIVVVVAGRIDRAALDPVWEVWEKVPRGKRGSPARLLPEDGGKIRNAGPGPNIVFQQSRRASCDLVFAYPGFGEGDPASILASMLRHILHRRINDRLREARIPLYDLWFHMHNYEREGIFYAGARVTEYLARTVEIMNAELHRVRAEAPSPEEVDRVREWNRTYLVQLLDRPDEYAGRLAIETLYGASLDPAAEWRATEEVRAGELRKVAARLFRPEALTFCLLGSPGFREKRQIRRLLREAARKAGF